MLTLHHLENSRSQRIVWLLEELGVDYELKLYKRDASTSLAPPELLDIHPLGKAPILTDDDAVIAESGAIIEYLVDRFDDGRLRPSSDSPEFLAYRYWLHYAEGTFMPLMIVALIMHRIETAPVPFFVKPIAKGFAQKVRENYLDANVSRNLDFMEQQLGKTTWFVGDELTAADVQMSFAVEAAAARSARADAYPRLADFLSRMRERPAYQRALEKGGPHRILGTD